MPVLRSSAAPAAADVVVVGAGINGLAITREIARRGLRVVMIDQDDIAARTSAISTRLIHGGLKYLERLEIPLVFESIRERNILLRTAPHLVHPYPMLIPFSRGASRPGWLLSCGLILHDVLSVGKRLPPNRIVLSKRMRRDWPTVAAGGVRWGGLFQDAHVPVTERFAVELAIDAYRHGAVILTHTPVLSLLHGKDEIAGVVYRDRETSEERQLSAPLVINCAGPWVDDVLALEGNHQRRIGPTKGSHLVVDRFPAAPQTCIFFESPDDQRPMFVLPWRDGKFMIGTTDLPYSGDLDDIVVDDDEIDYLLRAVNTLIPDAELSPADVLWSYSGVRPLPFSGGTADPASVTRDSDVTVHDGSARGLMSVIGGKYTTHRALGEQVLRRVESAFGMRHRPSGTKTAMLPGVPPNGAERLRAGLTARTALPATAIARLTDVYGAMAWEVAAIAEADPVLARCIDPLSGAIAAEVVYAVQEEGAFTLEDVLLRRTTIALNADVGMGAAGAAAEVLVEHAGWAPERAARELDDYRRSMQRFSPRGRRLGAPSREHVE